MEADVDGALPEPESVERRLERVYREQGASIYGDREFVASVIDDPRVDDLRQT
jgi:hypothetical protein